MNNYDFVFTIKSKSIKELISFFEMSYHPYEKNRSLLSLELNKVLVDLDITQQELANRSGEDKSYISRLLSGRIENPSKYRMAKICIAAQLGYEKTEDLISYINYSLNTKDILDSAIIYILCTKQSIIELWDILNICLSHNLISINRCREIFTDFI